MKGGGFMRDNKNSIAMAVVNGAFSALAPLLVLIIAYAASGVFPFGESLLLCSRNSEWFSQFAHYHSVIMGESSMFYSFSEGLGADFYSIFSGGFGNPFWLLSAFYTPDTLHGSVSVIMLIQSAAAGLFSYLMFSRLCREQKLAAVVFASAYSGGSLFALGFLAPQYSGAAVFLPLVGTGILALCEKGSFVTLFLSMVLFLAAAADLWPCLMIFCAILFAWGMMVCGDKNHLSTRVALLIVSAGLSFASAMVFLMPMWLTGVELGAVAAPVSEIDHASVTALISGLFPGGFSGRECAPLIFTSSMVLLMLPVYFFNSQIGLGERQVSGFSMLFMLICMSVPALGWIWLCAADPTGIIVGMGFVFCLLACACAIRSLSQAAKSSVRLIMISWIVILLLFLVTMVLRWGEISMELLIFTGASLTLFAAITLIVLSSKKITIAFCVVMFFCVMCECVLGCVFSFVQAKDNLGLMTMENYAVRQQQREWVDGTVSSCENGLASPFFRIRGAKSDKYYQIGDGDMATPKTEALMDALGISDGRGFTPFTDALFGVRYVVTGGASEYIYPMVGSDETGAIYMNNASMALGFTAPEGITGVSSFSANPFIAQNELATAAAGASRPLFNTAEITGWSGIGATVSETLTGAEVIRYEEAGYVRFSVLAPSDGMLYMYIDCDADNVELVQIKNNITSVTLGAIGQLGYVSRGETVDIIMTVSEERLVLDGMYFAVLDSVLLTAALEEFSAQQPSQLAADGRSIRGTIYVPEGEVLLTSIPYMAGWKAAVDGVEVKTKAAAGALLAVEIPAGDHTFEIWYEPTFFTAGLVISLIAFALGMIYACAAEVLRRRNEESDRQREAAEAEAEEAYAHESYLEELREVVMAYQDEYNTMPEYVPTYANDGVDAEYAGFVDYTAQQFLTPDTAEPFFSDVSAQVQNQLYQPVDAQELYQGMYAPDEYTQEYQEAEYYPDEFYPEETYDPYSGYAVYQQPVEMPDPDDEE